MCRHVRALHNVATVVRVAWDAPLDTGSPVTHYVLQVLKRHANASDSSFSVNAVAPPVTDTGGGSSICRRVWTEFGDQLCEATASLEPPETADAAEAIPFDFKSGVFMLPFLHAFDVMKRVTALRASSPRSKMPAKLRPHKLMFDVVLLHVFALIRCKAFSWI